MKEIRKYFKVWCKLAECSFLMQCSNRWSSLGWLGGKIVRFVFFFIFLTAIFKHVPSVAGYSLLQVALFYLTFNLIDILTQFLFRGIYMVGRDIREGDMDFYLIQPIHPLFRISSNLVDFLDLLTLIPVLLLTILVLKRSLNPLPMGPMILHILLYGSLCLNGVLIAFAIHLFIASITVRTQQMENTIWLYRDMASLGRFPVDVYSKKIQILLSTVLPIAVMVSYPAKAILDLLSLEKVIFAFLLSSVLLFISHRTWNSALRHYCSVSS